MRLIFLPVNNAWVFMFGDQITEMGNWGRFFQSRDEAVAAALQQGLRVDGEGNVGSIAGEGKSPELGTDVGWSLHPSLATGLYTPPADTPGREKQGNILDPIHQTLDPRVFDDPAAPAPTLKPALQQWLTNIIFEILERHGYDNPGNWLTLVLTGSLTTYQYSDASDCDVSLFVDSEKLPDWSRAEMIAFMVADFDNVNLPGTTYPIQAFIVPPSLNPNDLYKSGLRSGYVVYGDGMGAWLVPPDRERVHDVETEMNDAYTVGLLAADKLDLLLRYEPEHAIEYWHNLHKQRMADQTEGKGDFSTANIVFKMLVNRGLAQEAAKLAGDRYLPG